MPVVVEEEMETPLLLNMVAAQVVVEQEAAQLLLQLLELQIQAVVVAEVVELLLAEWTTFNTPDLMVVPESLF
jgi:hypothetical protein